MSDLKKNTQQAIEMAKFLNVSLTAEQIVAVEQLLGIGVSPIGIVRLLQQVPGFGAQGSPSNRENAL